MVHPCYDCHEKFLFPHASPEDAVFLCQADADERRLTGSFDNSPKKLSNFARSEPLELLGRPVVVSRTRVHESKQEGLVAMKERPHADV